MRALFALGLTLVVPFPGGRSAVAQNVPAAETRDDAAPGPGPDGEPAAPRGEWREYREEDADAPGEMQRADTAPAEGYGPALDPYGRWYEDRDYGQVWRPTVPTGWMPYADGSWAWSPWGWTWVSFEPWAWTFHYGCWVASPGYGWVWVPGSTWGPAWVTWYFGDGYVGWAPLSPGGPVVTMDRYVFVRERDFSAPHVRSVVVSTRHVPRAITDGWSEQLATRRRPPDPAYLGRIASHEPRRIEEKPVASIAPWRRDKEATVRPSGTPSGAPPAPSRSPSPWSATAPPPAEHESAPGWVRPAQRPASAEPYVGKSDGTAATWRGGVAPPPQRVPPRLREQPAADGGKGAFVGRSSHKRDADDEKASPGDKGTWR